MSDGGTLTLYTRNNITTNVSLRRFKWANLFGDPFHVRYSKFCIYLREYTKEPKKTQKLVENLPELLWPKGLTTTIYTLGDILGRLAEDEIEKANIKKKSTIPHWELLHKLRLYGIHAVLLITPCHTMTPHSTHCTHDIKIHTFLP